MVITASLPKALHFEEEVKNGMGAAVAEKVLQVTESILHEVSSTQQVLVRSISQEVRRAFLLPPIIDWSPDLLVVATF